MPTVWPVPTGRQPDRGRQAIFKWMFRTHLPAAFDPLLLQRIFTPLLRGDGWDAGRQGTGYRKLDLRWKGLPELEPARAMALTILKPFHPGMYDEWLLWYTPGDYVPPHRDPPLSDGLAHWRLNVLVEAGVGGDLYFNGELCVLKPGDALFFRPDAVEHAVNRLESGRRLLWSLGTNYPAASS